MRGQYSDYHLFYLILFFVVNVKYMFEYQSTMYVCMYVYFIHASVSHMGRLAAGRCRWLGMATNIFIYIQDIEPVDF